MHSLPELLKKSQENRVAIGHFNVSDFVVLKAPPAEKTQRVAVSWQPLARQVSDNVWIEISAGHQPGSS
jgi:hypothetical protein